MRKQVLMITIDDSKFYQENHLVPPALWLAVSQDQLPLLEETNFTFNGDQSIELTTLYNDAVDLCKMLLDGVLVQVDPQALEQAGIPLHCIRPDLWSVPVLPFHCCTLRDPNETRDTHWSLAGLSIWMTPDDFLETLKGEISEAEYHEIKEGFNRVISIDVIQKSDVLKQVPESAVSLHITDRASVTWNVCLDNSRCIHYVLPDPQMEVLDLGENDEVVAILYGNGLRAFSARSNIAWDFYMPRIPIHEISGLASKLLKGKE